MEETEETTIGVTLIDGKTEIFTEAEGQKPHFSFKLCHKNVGFGEIQLKQWWMDTRTIYPVGNREAIQYSPLIDFWSSCCVQDGNGSRRDVCESLILARILPNNRNLGSRRVFLDSKISSNDRKALREHRSNIEKSLRSANGEELTIMQFYENVRDVIGPPEYPQVLWDKFIELKSELFDEAVAVIQRGNVSGGIELGMEKWATLMNSIGRRGNLPIQKTIIDIFSYETRAAVHRCYSTLWEQIIEWLYIQSGKNPHSHTFHHLWHRDITWPARGEKAALEDRKFHLLHGHLFALHPASGDFIETKTGRTLLGDWISAAGKDWKRDGVDPQTPAMRRLLHGLSVAFYCYQGRHAETKDAKHENTQWLTDKDADDSVFKPHRGRRKVK